ncbi:hypothetical protein LTS07_001681 [Exophiala sideris]|uniref:NACHT domain-containing protein n=1 Tax=Exophiala sideris TaxID=1016849 RepID=A0ABR0JQV3_9EURO|nr:hypothetical protein LTS07_001681 [Exophiala sideris]KAK5044196.1 hypothetical protein LTR13_000552 [Exophiala sideris]KAK5067696.1 hypothetical protein LTR69_001685 [Exophiala sideris]
MALAVRQAATFRPEIRLGLALSEYEALLDDNQKATMRTYRAQQPPTTSDVMRLTAEIDKENSRRSNRRCVGPRLTNVLQCVQQFSSIVDIIIKSSGSPIASGVWAAVKLTLQIASGWASYFDKLSALLMDIGRTSPRYEELGVLYSSSAGLQKALCEYMIVVVGLCKKAVVFERKHSIAQFSLSIIKPFETEFGNLRAELDRLATTIRDEVSVAATKEHQLEMRDNSTFRTYMGKFSDKLAREMEEVKAFQKRRRKVQFLDACSLYNHQTAWKSARKFGTSSWIYTNQQYQTWIHAPSSSLLWCTGILGAGKTVLTANVVENVVLQAPDAGVAYFFCRYDDLESLKARTIIGSLTKQLLSSLEPKAFESMHITGDSTLETEQMLQYLQKLLPVHRQRCFIILDGLDECSQEEIATLMQFLRSVLTIKTTLQVFCASRPELHR